MSVIRFRDENGKVHEIIALRGDPGKAGADGKDYVLTDEDKAEIADMVLANIPIYNGETEDNDITFKINDVTMTAPVGMTWYEFVNSEYARPVIIYGEEDTLVCHAPSENVYTNMYGGLIVYSAEDDTEVLGSHEIVADNNYCCLA